jgi:ATP-dependent DNA helicase RecG
VIALNEGYSAKEFARLIEWETDEIELKTGLGVDPLQEALVALSNTNGGVIFVGVKDDRTVVGRSLDQGVEDKIHEAVLAARDVGRYSVREIVVGGRTVVAIQVHRREEGFAQTSSGRLLVRRGGRNVALFGSDLQRHVSERALRRFESSDTGLPFSQADDENLTRLSDAFRWARADEVVERAYERGLATADGNMTIAGALFLTEPAQSLGQSKAIVDVRRYSATGADYDRRIEFTGPLDRQVADATRFLVEELGTDLVVTGVYRHELPRLPENVVREAIANAVAHRSYEIQGTAVLVELYPESVVVTSPGGLPEPVTVENMRQAQSARNPHVIDVLRRFRLAEDAGRGVDIMQDSMADALLEPPAFTDLGHAVKVTLPLHGPITPRERAWVSELEVVGDIQGKDKVLLVLAARGETLTNAIAREALGVGHLEARLALHRLRDAGLLVQAGERGGAAYSLVERIAPPAAFRMRRDEMLRLVVAEAADRPITNQRVRELTGLDRRHATTLLQQLVSDGRLIRMGERRGTRYLRAE